MRGSAPALVTKSETRKISCLVKFSSCFRIEIIRLKHMAVDLVLSLCSAVHFHLSLSRETMDFSGHSTSTVAVEIFKISMNRGSAFKIFKIFMNRGSCKGYLASPTKQHQNIMC